MNDKRVVGMSKKLGLRRVEVPGKPIAPKPSAVAAEEAESETTEKPTSGNPEAENPTAGNPTTPSGTTGNPEAGNPEAGNPTTGVPAAGKQANDDPAAERPAQPPRLPSAPATWAAPPATPWSGPVVRQAKPLWPAPESPAPRRVLYAGAAAGLTAATVLPLDVPGVGWLLTGIVGVVGVFLATGRRSPQSIAWAVAALLLLSVSTFLTADWLFTLSLLAASAAGSLAVTDGRSLRGVVAGMVAVPIAAFPATRWAGRGLKAARRPTRSEKLGRTILISAGLLLVFVPLLAGADAAFADLLGNLVPSVDLGSPFEWGFLFFSIGLGTIGACYVQATTLPLDAEPSDRRTVARREWAVPIGLLVAVFTVFVGVQLASLFGGDDYVQRTAQLTYAEYARGGFWQLLAVTVLTLVVIAVATRFAAVETAADRLWLRGLLGGLAGLTLVIVASALSRMWAYQQAYGFTALRLLVFACEVWLAVVYLLVIAAGVKLRATWLPRTLVGTAVASLLVLAALNPDRFIAEHNVERWQATGKIDLPYLGTLSVDAVPAFDPLPADVRECLLVELKSEMTDTGDWYAWNLSRELARPVLAQVPWERGCDLGYSTTR